MHDLATGFITVLRSYHNSNFCVNDNFITVHVYGFDTSFIAVMIVAITVLYLQATMKFTRH